MGAGGEIVASLPRQPTRADYEPTVKALWPHLEAEEVELRSSLLYIRDRAMATKHAPHTCEPAWQMLDVAERQASDWALNHRIDIKGLRKLRKACITAICAAAEFDSLFVPTLPLGEGEADGRG